MVQARRRRKKANNNTATGNASWYAERGSISMKRKPDLLWVLVILFSLGMVTTGYTEGLWDRQGTTQTVSQDQ